MAYTRVYENRINWENEPSLNTALDEDNLNYMDYAINKIDEVLSDWDNSKADTSDIDDLELAISNLLTALNSFKTTTNAELTRLNQVKPEKLADQKDVTINNPTEGEALIYSNNRWRNGTADVGLFIKNGILMCRYSK